MDSLKALFQDMQQTNTQVLKAKVTGINPLVIAVAGDEKLILPQSSIIVSEHLKEHTVTADISGGDTELTGATMTVKSALAVNDTVYLLSLNCGKKYFVIDRE